MMKTELAQAVAETVDTQEAQVIELYGEKTVRWFQQAVRAQVREALKLGFRNILVIQPTGTGKTISSAIILLDEEIRTILGIKDRPINVLFVSHRRRLLSQAEATYAADAMINVITQTIGSPIPDDVEFDLVIFDEAHHEATLSFQMRLDAVSKAPMIGLTATPDRNDGRLCKFDYFIEPITREQAVEQGYLSETEIHTYVDSPDRSHVDIVLDIIKWQGAEMGQEMIFCRTKEDGLKMLTGLRKLGYTGELLVDVTETRLNELLKGFEDRKFQFAVSCMKIGEGVDVKGCEGVIVARTLKSRGLLNQMIGRAARPDSKCVVREIINPLASDNISAIDIVGVASMHNFYYKVRNDWRTHELTTKAA